MATVSKITVKIGADTVGLEKGLKTSEKGVSKFSQSVKKIGGLIAGAFAVSALVNFTKEAVQMAGAFEGVERKFNTLNVSINELRESVQGTVSDLELMKSTNVAANLGVDVKEMGMLFEFAALKANETGESVQFLVESITKGIGRKSPLILDNLGISAIALKEALGGVGLEAASVADVTRAVGKIASEALKEAGDQTLTAAQQMAKYAAEIENAQVNVGKLLLALGEKAGLIKTLDNLATEIETITNLLTFFSSDIGEKGELYKNTVKYIRLLSKGIIPGLAAWVRQTGFVQEKLSAFGKEAVRSLGSVGTTVQTVDEMFQGLWESIFGPLKEQERGGLIIGMQKEIEDLTKSMEESFDPKQIREYAIQISDLTATLKELTDVNRDATSEELKRLHLSTRIGKKSEENNELLIKQTTFLKEAETASVGFTEGLEDGLSMIGAMASDVFVDMLPNMISGVTAQFEALAAGADANWKSVISSTLGGVSQILNALLAQAIGGIIASGATAGLKGALIAAAVGVPILKGLWDSKVPAFAQGGAAFGPTMAMVGEAPGISRSNPEYIGTAKQLGLGSGPIVMDVVITGDEIRLTQNRNAQKRKRY